MKKSLLFLSAFLVTVSCSTLRDAADVREPNVSFQSMSIDRITFEGVTLLFDFEVDNPNRFGVSAEQYNYEFFINDRSFITGVQEDPLQIGRESSHTIQVPVALTFSEVYETFGSMARQDSMSYALSAEVEFDMPVIGRRKVPVQATGEIPVPKMPRITVGDFNVNEISLNGADVEVEFNVMNPNPFSITFANAAYELTVNGREWVDTTLGETVRVEGSERRTIKIPIRLNSSQLGSAMFDIMSGNTTFNYDLKGSADITADLEGFRGWQTFPFDLSGRYTMD